MNSQSKHNLKNKKELLGFVRKFPDGIDVVDLKDSYPAVLEDLQVCPYFFFFSHFSSPILQILVYGREGG